MAGIKYETKLTLKIRAFGSQEQLDDLFEKLNEMGFLSRSEDITLVCGYFLEEDGVRARDAAEELMREHPAIMKSRSTTGLSTKRTVSSTLPSVEEAGDDEDEEGEELPLLAAIDRAIADEPHFDDLPLRDRVLRLLRVAPQSVPELVEALHNAESAAPNPTAEAIETVLDSLYGDDLADLNAGRWHLVEQAPADEEPEQESLFDTDALGEEIAPTSATIRPDTVIDAGDLFTRAAEQINSGAHDGDGVTVRASVTRRARK